MKSVLFLMAVTASAMSLADGFVCTSESGLNIKVYNHTQAEAGTRTASIMVISDSAVGAGNKTIASFQDVKGTLNSSSQVYVADVDLRFSGSNRAGELIGGTKLGQLDQITLEVDFSYASPLKAGSLVSGELTLLKRNGDQLVEAVNCARYLKN